MEKDIEVNSFKPTWNPKEGKHQPGTKPEKIGLYSVLDRFVDPVNGYKGTVDIIRDAKKAGKSKAEIDSLKTQNLHAITFSCTTSTTRGANNDIPTGIIVVDLDQKHNPNIDDWHAVARKMSEQSGAIGSFISASGEGCFFLVKYNKDLAKHLDVFYSLQKELSEVDLNVDDSCKDLNRLRFVTYDPDGIIFRDWDSILYYEPTIRTDSKKSYALPPSATVIKTERIEKFVKAIEDAKVNIAESHEEWLRLGFAFASIGEAGREYFYRVSKQSTKFDSNENERKFDTYLEKYDPNRPGGPITIATFYHACTKAGIRIPAQQTGADCFPEELYECLPPAIAEICLRLKDNDKRDVAFLGIVTALSAAFSRYRFYHGGDSDQKEYSPHLFCIVVGDAGSGKGLTRYGRILTKQIAEEAMRRQRESWAKFQQEIRMYKGKGKKEAELKEPQKPPRHAFEASASDTTQPALVEMLNQNPKGIFGYDSEIDTLASRERQKGFWGI